MKGVGVEYFVKRVWEIFYRLLQMYFSYWVRNKCRFIAVDLLLRKIRERAPGLEPLFNMSN